MTTSTRSDGGFLDQRFRLTERGSDVRTEALAGITTFMTMAYTCSSTRRSWGRARTGCRSRPCCRSPDWRRVS